MPRAERFDDEVDLDIVMDEAKTYYANIIMPYPKAVLTALDHIGRMEIGTIAPSHGLIWRRHGAEIVAAYRDWANHRSKPKVLVIYDTMWESTAAMAEAIIEGAVAAGREHVADSHSPLEPHADRGRSARRGGRGVWQLDPQPRHDAHGGRRAELPGGLRPQKQGGIGFGSYGWGRGGPEAVDEALRALEWEVLREPLRARYRPTPAVLDECRQRRQAAGRARTHTGGQLTMRSPAWSATRALRP